MGEQPLIPQTDVAVAKERWPSDLHIEQKLGKDVTTDDHNDFRKYIGRERELAIHGDKQSDDYLLKLQSGINNSFAVRYLEESRMKYPQSVVMFVRKNNDNSIVGNCITLIEKQQDTIIGVSTHIGLGWEYQKMGIGSQLLAKHIAALKKERVHTMFLSVWEGSKRLVDKLRLQYDVDPERANGIKISLT